MRYPTVWVTGVILPEELGGGKADIALGHALRSLRDLAVALDAFEEDVTKLASAGEAQRALINATRVEVRVQTPAGEATQVRHLLPESLGEPVQYWVGRQVVHAKAAVLALDQFKRALVDFRRFSKLPSAQAAVDKFDAAFPFLQQVRNSVSHVNERARLEVARREDGVGRLTDYLSKVGYCQGSEFVMRITDASEDTARLRVEESSLAAAHAILQELASSVPWQVSRERPERLRAALSG